MIDIEPLNIVLDFGKYRGTALARTPANYLRWMVNQHGMPDGWRELANAELARRGTTIPQVEITAHAIDRASLRLLTLWARLSRKDEGLHSWLQRMTLDALAAGAYVEGVENARDLHGVRWVVEEGVEYPTLITVYLL